MIFSNLLLLVGGIVVVVILSAFFSGMEIAYLSSDRLTMEISKEKKTLKGAILRMLFRNPDLYIATMLVGNNIVLVLYGLLMSALIDPGLHTLGLPAGLIIVLDSLIATFIIIIFGEYIPKRRFMLNANRAMQRNSFLILLFYIVLFPITLLATLITKLFSLVMGRGSSADITSKLTVVDLEQYLSENYEGEEGHLDTEVKIMQKAIDFSRVKARDCMVPRNELIACEVETSLENLKKIFVSTGISKVIVFKEGIDEVIGYIHAQEVFRGEGWQNRIKKAPYVPESMYGHKLMRQLMQTKRSLAVVIDEMGGTAGIITLEDLVEEIFGEIEDEHDKTKIVIHKVSNSVFIISGRAEIDEINESCGINLPEEDEYNTLAGLIISIHRSIPQKGETVILDKFTFEILRSTSTRVELVKLTVSDD